MNLAARTVTTVLTASLGIALVGCSAAAQAAPSDALAQTMGDTTAQLETTADETTAEAATDAADPCAATPDNRIDFSPAGNGPIYASLRHDLIDLGESSYAQGEVALDDEGKISSYTVAPGDSPIAIGDRFCVDYVTVLQLNNTWPEIDPGEVLVLRPDPTVEWIDEAQVIDEDAP